MYAASRGASTSIGRQAMCDLSAKVESFVYCPLPTNETMTNARGGATQSLGVRDGSPEAALKNVVQGPLSSPARGHFPIRLPAQA